MQEAARLLQEGIAHHCAGSDAMAERCYAASLAADPAQPMLWHLRGLLAAATEDFATAAAHLGHAVVGAPEAASVWGDLGACLYRLGRLDAAAAVLGRALRLDPRLASALGCLGLVQAAQGAAEPAEASFRAALALRPDLAATHTNLGNLLRDAGRLAEAEASLRAALALQPGSADALHNLAAVLVAAGCTTEAAACCRAALAIAPDHADARYTLGTARLLEGRLAEGWDGFAWRWRRRGFTPPPRPAAPLWDGAPLAGRTLLLHAEQGLGDAIQMLRFVPAIAAGGRVVLAVPAALQRLARTLGGDPCVVRDDGAWPACDVRCSLLDLPGVLGVTLASIPATVPYLGAQPSARVAMLPGLRVGLAWAGNPRYAADRRRSIPAARLAALGGVPGVSFVSLQPAPVELPDLPLADWTAGFADLADTACVIAGLDLVIAVDSAVAHLAAALGRPVWLLNRFDTCWRWMLGRDDSPWYPTLRIFRQPAPGDWDSVLGAVGRALADHARAARNARM